MKFWLKQLEAIEYIDNYLSKAGTEYIDAVITDPPYNISKDNNFTTMNRAGIIFGEWDYNFDQTTWIKKIAPYLKKGGSIIVFNCWKNLGQIAKTLEESGFLVKDILRWIKNNPMPRNINRRYVVDYEFIIWAVKKGKKWTFHKNSKTYARPEYKYPIVPKSKVKIHPTQKPVALMEEIILRHTNENDLICDLFMGSGATGIAAIQNKRRFLGNDIDAKYFNFAKKRLKEVQNE